MKKSPRILELCLNTSLGGLELYYSWCCEYFYKNSPENLICVTLQDSRLQQRLESLGIRPVLFQNKGPFWRLHAARQLARLCDSEQIDVVHVHFVKDLATVALAKTLSRRQWKLIHTRQMEMPGFKKDLYHRWVYSHVDHILCITDRLTRDVRERVPLRADQITRLYYGVAKPAKNEQRLQEFFTQFPSSFPKVAMFSRLEKSKGQYRTVQVLAKLKEQGVPFQLYLFGHFMGGDGYEKELKDLICKLNVQDRVYFCGFQEKPSELMTGFDAIVLPSDQETFGLVLIEAMAAGVAVMGANTGGVPEIIEDGVTGYTFAPNDLESFSQKLKILLSDKAVSAPMVAAGLQKHRENFSYDEHFEALDKIFINCLN